jgi:ABC-type polysaccharide/polyol phosphate export permease
VFGLLWSLIRPLAMLIVYYVAIGQFLGAERSIPDFAICIFTGLVADRSWSTASSRTRYKTSPRLREVRRLKRNTNSSR